MFQYRIRTAAAGAWSRRALVGAAACVASFVVAASPAHAGMAAVDPDVARAEQDYMAFTIDHHAGGVEMAELGLEKTENPTLIDLSTTIRATQAREIEELQGYLSDWYGQKKTPMVPVMSEQDMARLSALDGLAFDVDYSRTFIMHHTTIINRSAEILEMAEHEALRDFAFGVIETQSAEIPVFASVIRGGATAIPLPAPVAMGFVGLAGAGLATWRQRRKQFA